MVQKSNSGKSYRLPGTDKTGQRQIHFGAKGLASDSLCFVRKLDDAFQNQLPKSLAMTNAIVFLYV